jgi:hypothetical protein
MRRTFNFNKYPGIQPAVREALNGVFEDGGLPIIKGNWYFVDPKNGSASAGGDADSPVASIETAYGLCLDGAGDGIVLLSGGTTSAHTTSYLYQPLTWSKSAITVVGAAAPTAMGGRARVANKTLVSTVALVAVADTSITRATGSFITDGWVAGMKFITNVDAAAITVVTVTALTITVTGTLTVGAHTSMTSVNASLIDVSGSNNSFVNVHFFNGGTNALEVGGVIVSGERNYFGGCHIIGGAGAATSASNNSLTVTGSECTFRECTLGSNTYAQGDNAAAEIVLSGTVKRNKFIDCEIVGMVSAGTAHGAVKSVSTSGGAGTVFKNCLFNYALSGTDPAAAHLVSGACDEIILFNCASCQVTAWGGSVYANMIAPTAAAGGGLMTTA